MGACAGSTPLGSATACKSQNNPLILGTLSFSFATMNITITSIPSLFIYDFKEKIFQPKYFSQHEEGILITVSILSLNQDVRNKLRSCDELCQELFYNFLLVGRLSRKFFISSVTIFLIEGDKGSRRKLDGRTQAWKQNLIGSWNKVRFYVILK